MRNVETLNFEPKGNEQGLLVAYEQQRNIPFDIKRVYTIYKTLSSCTRGKHAHRNLEQVLLCLHGQVKIHVDNGEEKQDIWLNSPEKGLYIKGNIWREMSQFSSDCVLLVLASELYQPHDYIFDYNEFLKIARQSYDSPN